MTQPTQSGYVQTITGKISPDQVGVAMMHEHVFSETGVYFKPPADERYAELAMQPVSQSNLWFVRYNSKGNRDNLMMNEFDVAQKELQMLVDAGGHTFVDLTPTHPGARTPQFLELAQSTGLNIVKGVGYYIEGSYPEGSRVHERSIDEIAQEFVDRILVGDPEYGLRGGILGEIGCSWPMTATEEKVLRAAVRAQLQTGVAMNVHPGRNDQALFEIRDILLEEGADMSRVIISHMDRSGYELETRRAMLDAGLVIEYDLFGQEGYYPAYVALAENTLPDMPNDLGRIKQIMELLELGYAGQILISQDICMKMSLATYGGYGYGHILRNVLPLMKIYGMTDEDIDLIIRETPKRLLTIPGE